MSDLDIVILVLFIIGLALVGGLGAFALWRKQKAYIVTVKRNYMNPSQPEMKYYAIVDIPAKAIRAYKSLLSLKPVKNVPLFNINAFAGTGKRVDVVTGVSGKPNDDMWIPMGLTLLSQAAAAEYARTMSDNITANLDYYNELSTYDFRIGEKVEFTQKKKSGKDKKIIDAQIDAITTEGIIINYEEEKDTDGKKTKIQRHLLIDKVNLGMLSTAMEKKEKLQLPAFGYNDLFSAQWVMKTMGIRKVEDANIVTIPQKTAVASLASRANEFVLDRAGFLEKHSGLIIGCLIMVFMGLTAIFIFYGANTFYSGITADIHSFIANGGTAVAASTTGTTQIAGVNVPT